MSPSVITRSKPVAAGRMPVPSCTHWPSKIWARSEAEPAVVNVAVYGFGHCLSGL